VIRHDQKDIRYYTFSSFPGDEVIAACFTRLGGISEAPYKSLNVGSTVGDERRNVDENRNRLFQAISLLPESLYDAWQVHSTDYAIVKKPRDSNFKQKKVDILLTQNPKVTLMMRFADCVPIFLFAKKSKVVGLVHAGWKGSINRIALKAVEIMVNKFHCEPFEILAGIGPSIGPDHYEVGKDVVYKIQTNFKNPAQNFYSMKENRTFLDLWALNRFILEEAGVKAIEIAGICTACNLQEWYSHRQEKGKTGRFGAVITLK
jgi:YfiH family protein